MTTEYETRTTAIMVLPKDEAIFSERGTTIRITDDAGGEYVEVVQAASMKPGVIFIEEAEWPTLRAAIDRMIGECRKGDE